MLTLVAVVLLVLISSGLCSGSEAALLSVPLSKARQLAETGGPAARALLVLRERLTRPISAIVILNNVANIAGSMMVAAVATQVLGDAWLGIFSGVMTLLIILFSEILPKSLGERYAIEVSLALSRPLLALVWVLTPVLWLVEKITEPLRGGELKTTDEAEIRFLVRTGTHEGEIEPDESEMILNVFRLNDVTARDILTPRVAMSTLPVDARLAEVRRELEESQHSRMVVVGEDIDDVRGLVLRVDLLVALAHDRDHDPVVDYLYDVLFVPETERADHLLSRFQREKQHLAVVTGPYGGVSGVVTLEDVLEVITGEIVDETDLAVDLQEVARRRAMAMARRRNGGRAGTPGDLPEPAE
jgi:CBS domain containing-hemolysin-like protein